MAAVLPISPTDTGTIGVDGDWYAFALYIGNQPAVSVYPSTSQHIPYVVASVACGGYSGQALTECEASHGGLFISGHSRTWNTAYTPNPNQVFHIPNVAPFIGSGAQNGAIYGYDYVAIGPNQDRAVGKHAVGEYSTNGLYLGLIGLVPKPAILPADNEAPTQSILENFKQHEKIGSLSWGYTAGAPYRLGNTGRASLTLGGFDQNKLSATTETGAISVEMKDDDSRLLTVAIQSIQTETKYLKKQNVLQKPIYATLDSTYAQIYLPPDTCKLLAEAFKLTEDKDTGYYFINPQDRHTFRFKNPMPYVNFTLSASTQDSSSTVEINMPYAAFDKMLQPPLIDHQRHYFPIKKASDPSLYNLGRTFFQEAYVIADWERGNFSVYPTSFAAGDTFDYQPINSPKTKQKVKVTHPDSSSSPAGVIAGVVVAVVVVIIAGVLGWWFWRRRKRRQQVEKPDSPAPPYSEHVNELLGDPQYRPLEKRGTELDATEKGQTIPIHDAKPAAGQSALSSPEAGATEVSSNMRSPLSEMDATQYFELPGSMDTRRSLGPQEMNAVVSPTVDQSEQGTDTFSSSAPLPAPPEPSPPIETSTMTTNPLSARTDFSIDSPQGPPPPPKNDA